MIAETVLNNLEEECLEKELKRLQDRYMSECLELRQVSRSIHVPTTKGLPQEPEETPLPRRADYEQHILNKLRKSRRLRQVVRQSKDLQCSLEMRPSEFPPSDAKSQEHTQQQSQIRIQLDSKVCFPAFQDKGQPKSTNRPFYSQFRIREKGKKPFQQPDRSVLAHRSPTQVL